MDTDELIAVVLEAIDLPHGVTMADEEKRAQVLFWRALHLAVALENLTTEKLAEYETPEHARWGVKWHLDYLRERLAQHPVNYQHHDDAAMTSRLTEPKPPPADVSWIEVENTRPESGGA